MLGVGRAGWTWMGNNFMVYLKYGGGKKLAQKVGKRGSKGECGKGNAGSRESWMDLDGK